MGKSYLCPLFWQHHESEAALRREIQRMNESGIGSFIVESRPHPHYLQDEWWSDLEILIDEAKKRNMEVWFFDDGSYPSGVAAGLIYEKYPQYTKKYLAHHYIDAIGPMRGSSILVETWLKEEETLIGVVACRRLDGMDQMDLSSCVDITEYVEDGILYWDIPEGEWRIFILKQTPNGGEEYTRHYLNPLEKEGAEAFLELIYEAHYQHFAEEFGKTIKGFFSDEPRFGNAAGYTYRLGENHVLPWSDTLLEELSERGMGNFMTLIPALFYEAGEQTADVRFLYMDTVSKRFDQNFLSLLGAWCRSHQVRLIGHVVEENGVHARLAYGPGHYFRAMNGLDAAGIDVVNNVYPGRTDGKFLTKFNDYDTTFNHWGLSKMASSAAHLDPKKQGMTICEAFGAYGWSEGLKAMKWITDAICVRGVNVLVPHAFSPKQFPDPDCPPHFYAGGNNPQFPYFHTWADYANRVCDRITGGVHIAPAAVLYHAEAEWGGAYEPFEVAVKSLMQSQIDCDVLPKDVLCDTAQMQIKTGEFVIHEEHYRALIVPYAEYLPAELQPVFQALTEAGIPVIFTQNYPKRYYLGEAFVRTEGMYQMEAGMLAAFLRQNGISDICAASTQEHLAYYHYKKAEKDFYFLVNEDIHHDIETKLFFSDAREAVLYDAMEDRYWIAEQNKTETGTEVSILLKPYESIFVVFGENTTAAEGRERKVTDHFTLSDDAWKISVCEYGEENTFHEISLNRLENISGAKLLPRFSGTIRYEKVFEARAGKMWISLGEVYEAARVFLNGSLIGEKICPPYCLEIDEKLVKDGENKLVVEVANTLAKAHHDNPFDCYWVQEPSGLLGPVEVWQ